MTPNLMNVKIILYKISGGRFGTLFDDDPKQWRLYADFIGSTGRFDSDVLVEHSCCICDGFIVFYCSIFDLSTQLYPAYFLPLASVGNLAKVSINCSLSCSSKLIVFWFL